jgi:hypothetical protein
MKANFAVSKRSQIITPISRKGGEGKNDRGFIS